MNWTTSAISWDESLLSAPLQPGIRRGMDVAGRFRRDWILPCDGLQRPEPVVCLSLQFCEIAISYQSGSLTIRSG
jgi:hypothetical protein